MKKWLVMLCMCLILLGCAMPAYAADGNVTYKGRAEKFVFAPGSVYSPTDLFPNFKDVMPGDTLTQQITLKNAASNKVKVHVYMRSLGAHADSEEFLSQLKLRVEKSGDNTMEYMFASAADEAVPVFGWIYLGTLYSGGEVNLDVILDVPVELDNMYQQKIGYLDWEFMVEEYPIDPNDPVPPKTGDTYDVVFWAGAFVLSVTGLWVLFRNRKKYD